MAGLGTDVIVERTDPLTGEEFLTWAADLVPAGDAPPA